jgi:S1-C subfamily serine protease
MMSNIRFLVVLVLICSSIAAAQGKPGRQPTSSVAALSKVINVVRPSIVQINRSLLFPQAEKEALHIDNRWVLGTGFIVDVENGYVITALHVIRGGEQPITLPNGQPSHPLFDHMSIAMAIPNTTSKVLTSRADFSGVGFTVIARDERHDLALLKATSQLKDSTAIETPDGNVTAHPKQAVLYLGPLHDGDAITVSGYPLNQNVLITTSGAIASSDALEIQMIRPPGAPEYFSLPDIADSYVADVRVNPGNSGGPVYLTKSGTVVGVCVSFQPASVMSKTNGEYREVTQPNGAPLVYNSGLSVVVPAKYVADLLKQNRVKFQSTNVAASAQQ